MEKFYNLASWKFIISSFCALFCLFGNILCPHFRSSSREMTGNEGGKGWSNPGRCGHGWHHKTSATEVPHFCLNKAAWICFVQQVFYSQFKTCKIKDPVKKLSLTLSHAERFDFYVSLSKVYFWGECCIFRVSRYKSDCFKFIFMS